jgi:hypothetical protein
VASTTIFVQCIWVASTTILVPNILLVTANRGPISAYRHHDSMQIQPYPLNFNVEVSHSFADASFDLI